MQVSAVRTEAMWREAFEALEAIRLGNWGRLDDSGHWVDAFKTCLWVVETDQGLAMTDAGSKAWADLAKRYRKLRAA